MKFSSDCTLIIGKNLVVADLHMGILGFPDFTILEKLISAYERSNARRLIINGDVKHRLGRAELNSAERLIQQLEDSVSELVVIRGNHDGYLDQVTEVYSSFRDGRTVFAHGHKKYSDIMDAKRLVLAHSHPAVFIPDKVGGIKERAWLYSKTDDMECIVMPAFNEYCSSTAVNLEKPAGFIFKHVREFEAFTVDGFYFGKVRF